MEFSKLLSQVKKSKKIKGFRTIETDNGLVLEIEEKMGIYHSFLKSCTGKVRYKGRYNLLTDKTIKTFNQEFKIKKLISL